MLIYGNFLTNQEDLEDQSIVSIIQENSDFEETDNQHPNKLSYQHLILEIYGTSSNNSEEIKLPPVILSSPSSSFPSSIQKNLHAYMHTKFYPHIRRYFINFMKTFLKLSL